MSDAARLNRLRKRLRAAWDAHENPLPQIMARSEPLDRIIGDLSTLSSELGLRFVHLDLDGDLEFEQIESLARPAARMVAITNVDRHPENLLPTLEERIRKGARTIPVIVIPDADDGIYSALDALKSLRELEAARAERDARWAQA